jgi:glutathione S-transferase
MPAGKIKIEYFGLRGRAEAMKMMLAYAGDDFEEVTISYDDWPGLKADKEKYPFGGLPMAECGGKRYGQTRAILRMIGSTYGFYDREDALSCYQCDALMDCHGDMCDAGGVLLYAEGDDAVKAATEKLVAVTDCFLRNASGCAKKMGWSMCAGNKLTIADFCALMMYQVMAVNPNFVACAAVKAVWEKYPEMEACMVKLSSTPKFCDWLASRPATPM